MSAEHVATSGFLTQASIPVTALLWNGFESSSNTISSSFRMSQSAKSTKYIWLFSIAHTSVSSEGESVMERTRLGGAEEPPKLSFPSTGTANVLTRLNISLSSVFSYMCTFPPSPAQMKPFVPCATMQSMPLPGPGDGRLVRNSPSSITSNSPASSPTTQICVFCSADASAPASPPPAASLAPVALAAPAPPTSSLRSSPAAPAVAPSGASSGNQACAVKPTASFFPSALGCGRMELSVILKMRNEPWPTSDAVPGSCGFHLISRTGATGWLGARAGITAAHFSFSHCHTATFQSGAAPCAMTVRPSGEKQRLTYSCAFRRASSVHGGERVSRKESRDVTVSGAR